MKESIHIYNLRIFCQNNEQFNKVSQTLHITPNKQWGNLWCFEIEQKENDKYFDFINRFLDMLEGKYEQLELVGISKEDISVWFLYQYENQCNMEFLPKDLKRLGSNEISLCISCWEA